MERTTITESLAVAEAVTPADGNGRLLVQLITPGKGSSGDYPAETIEAAGKDRVFKAGTQMFVNHQTADESFTRPEGDLKDLAAVLTEDAHWTGEALVAEARVFAPWRATLADMAPYIGVSIRASAEVDESNGQRIITRLVEGRSVDFVTQAGRGGKVLEVLESHRQPVQEARNIGQWLEARMHSAFTGMTDDAYGDGKLTRDERIALSAALGDALTAFTRRVETDAPKLYERDLWEEPETSPATVGESKNVPSNPAGQTNPNDIAKEMEMGTITVDEAQHAQLVEASGRVPGLETGIAEAIKRAETAEALVKDGQAKANKATAKSIVGEAFKDVNAPSTVELLAANYPINESGDVNESALKTAAEKAAAEIAEAQGVGAPSGLGQRRQHNDQTVSDDDVAESIDAAFGGSTVKGA